MTQTAGDQFDRLPEELKRVRQWCIAGADKAPYVAGKNGLFRASVHDRNRWHTFEDAVRIARAFPDAGIGFMLTEEDPFTCIDIDYKNEQNEPKPEKRTTPAQIALYERIIDTLDSYTEISRGGLGLHIWCLGGHGAGVRRDGVEVYSRERFIICTGRAVRPKQLEERGEMVRQLVVEIQRGRQKATANLEELPEDYTDSEIWERAANAGNAEKFVDLCSGNWDRYLEYPSQSEADLSLLSMFAFYSRSNEQCRRMFRMTLLGQREKAQKNDVYINRTLRMIRGRQQAEAEALESGEELTRQLLANMSLGKDTGESEVASSPITPPEEVNGVQIDLSGQIARALQKQKALNAPPPIPDPGPAPDDHSADTIPWPPGLVGEVAKYFHASAVRPVREVAIVTALGLFAGICGRQFNISKSGLNLYIILIARSAIGKEAMHTGLSHLIDQCTGSPNLPNYIDWNDYVSGQALTKAFQNNNCFLNVSGEWGHKLRRLGAEDGRDAAMATLRQVMTNVYQKSGQASVVGGLSYSNMDNNVASTTNGVAYSMIGETTPGNFFEALTQNMMEDGFMSRFNLVEYRGDRPPLNPDNGKEAPEFIREAIGYLVTKVRENEEKIHVEPVLLNPTTQKIFSEFNDECDEQIRATDDESWRQMWNRAHLKALRIAALLAVADNCTAPIVLEEHAGWAISMVRRDISIMTSRMEEGDVGSGDDSRERKLLTVLRAYLRTKPPTSYGPNIATLHSDGIVPRNYLQKRTCQVSAFAKHRAGATASLDQTIRSLIDSGYLQEIPKTKLLELYNVHAKCYRVLNLPDESGRKKS